MHVLSTLSVSKPSEVQAGCVVIALLCESGRREQALPTFVWVLLCNVGACIALARALYFLAALVIALFDKHGCNIVLEEKVIDAVSITSGIKIFNGDVVFHKLKKDIEHCLSIYTYIVVYNVRPNQLCHWQVTIS